MKHWIVHFDVMTQVRGEEPVTHKRALLVMAEDSDTAEAIARPHATLFTFGPKTLAVEWRKTSTVSLPLDVTGGAAAPHGEADDHAAITTPGATT